MAMMDGGMGSMMNSMMGWMMGIGLLGWVLIIGLLAAILIVLVRLLTEGRGGGGRDSSGPASNRPHAP
jgi:hypothetical protein